MIVVVIYQTIVSIVTVIVMGVMTAKVVTLPVRLVIYVIVVTPLAKVVMGVRVVI